MEALTDLSWRIYPATAIGAAGALLFLRGLALGLDGLHRPVRDPDKNLTWMLGFRAALVGLAVVAVGAAWQVQQLWVLLLALAIGGEELLESSICIFALRRGKRIGNTAGFATSAG